MLGIGEGHHGRQHTRRYQERKLSSYLGRVFLVSFFLWGGVVVTTPKTTATPLTPFGFRWVVSRGTRAGHGWMLLCFSGFPSASDGVPREVHSSFPVSRKYITTKSFLQLNAPCSPADFGTTSVLSYEHSVGHNENHRL